MARVTKTTKNKKRSFHQELVLNRWVMRFFKGNELAALKLRLGDDQHEGIDEDGQTLFFHELTRNLFEVDWISEADLRRYDLHIVEHWQAITKHLSVLCQAGLVMDRKLGRRRLWKLKPRRLDEAKEYLDRIGAQWDEALARLADFVESEE